MQLSHSRRTLDVYFPAHTHPLTSCLSMLLITLVEVARWPTRWHPSFAPHRSVTCTTILCDHNATPRIDVHITRPTLPHCRPVTITSATPTSFTRVVNVDRSLECNHSLSHRVSSKSLIDAGSSESFGTSVARLGDHLIDARPTLRTHHRPSVRSTDQPTELTNLFRPISPPSVLIPSPRHAK
ncbi:BZ3500_MvSof-1268-A1-R1_C039g00058 [Microbotryum saponariae]|uniref:BZ3500_MvSof-1268-A1-R1_C039g00058 protein n=1 Tax=Microbotryum saponariae TaxID=289078 RepID=A0A2X0KMB0_9BASI|nr:BZ3500_MvSof-1268-A1-R1_C074g00381 [Microbotryum saponariae]SCZ99712.1 BZ3501_MvSof-1269-A2-R1_C47g00244 [Microbotryum saponariae]SDA02156.1 BZ3500_MvSof-1268-A1-R1_C039g00058 [Microbotryum saponariae]